MNDSLNLTLFFTNCFTSSTRNLRSFPQGIRSCYTINLTIGDEYLIRTNFLHGGYDDKPSTQFEIHLGPNLWTTVSTTNETEASIFEMIHVLTTDRLQICLVKTGDSTPFISALELRKLKNTTYLTQQGSLQNFIRADVGSINSQGFRFYKAQKSHVRKLRFCMKKVTKYALFFSLF